jgi:hypothetical protein
MLRTKPFYLFSPLLLSGGIAVIIALFALNVAAQSGRRTAKPPTPEATPTPETQPDPPKRPPPDKTGPTILVGIDNTDTFSNIPLYYPETVLRSCVDRLDDSSVKVDVVGRALTRGDAVKKAKELKEGEGYVALLQLKFDSMSNSNSSINDLVVEYVVFAPTTAKIATSGRAYLGSTQKGAIIPRTGGATNAMYAEQLLKRAGAEAAERILNGLHVGVLPRTGP